MSGVDYVTPCYCSANAILINCVANLGCKFVNHKSINSLVIDRISVINNFHLQGDGSACLYESDEKLLIFVWLS